MTKRPPVPGSLEDAAMLSDMANAAVNVGKPGAKIQERKDLGAYAEDFAIDAEGQRFSTDPTGNPEHDVGVDEEALAAAQGAVTQDDDLADVQALVDEFGLSGVADEPFDAMPDISEEVPAVTDDAEFSAQSDAMPPPEEENTSLVAEPSDPEQERRIRAAGRSLYGSDFPLIARDEPTESDWCRWASGLWDRHRAGVQNVLHLVERNRLMRAGEQWISSVGVGPWREPPKPREAVRAVENVIKPALDQRVQILREQVPGFQCRPTTRDVDSQKKAEAQQIALEYSYAEQGMAEVLAEAAYWVGTDGVAFLGPYWHPDAGPWSEQEPQGDVRTCVYRIEQVRVSANASATEKPHYWIIRETIPTAQAVAQYGVAVVDADESDRTSDLASTMASTMTTTSGVNIDELYRDQPTVDRFTVFIDRSEFLPQGLTLIAVGKVLALQPSPLLYGVVPLTRMTDGSVDPAFYPMAVMNDWVPHQIRINALVSKWIESIRVNAGGRFLMKSGVVATETLVGGTTSVIEVKGAFNSINDAMTPVTGFSVGSDVKDALEREKAIFEQKSGWNDASRGSFASTTSGRAILAVREQLERIYAPGVASAAHAMSEWGKIVLHIYRAMLSVPRAMAMTGKGRPDLGRLITAEDFDGVSEVEIDPETLMPMPRSLKLSLLDQLYQTQVIDAQEYRRRLPFAFTGSLETPDDVQQARAARICDAFRQGQPAPEMRWQDNESIHQDVLEREILLRDDLDPMVIAMANERWVMLAQQAAMKSGAMQPPAPPGDPSQGGPPDKPPLDPMTAPVAGSFPSVAAEPMGLEMTDQQGAGSQFDQMSPL